MLLICMFNKLTLLWHIALSKIHSNIWPFILNTLKPRIKKYDIPYSDSFQNLCTYPARRIASMVGPFH